MIRRVALVIAASSRRQTSTLTMLSSTSSCSFCSSSLLSSSSSSSSPPPPPTSPLPPRRVLVLNAGSSSLKLKLFEEEDSRITRGDGQGTPSPSMSSSSSPTLVPVASALVERLGTDAATLRSWRRRNSKRSEGASSGCGNGRDEEEQQQEGPRPVAARDVRAALAAALPSLGLKGGNSRSRSISSINGSKSNSNDGGDSNQDLFACGHRIVHGGELSASKEWPGEGGGGDNDNDDDDNSTRAAVAAATPLAPLHNPRNAEAADAALELFPEATHVAVFDTAFHVASLPEEAYTYALPRSMRTLGGGGGGGSVNNNSSSSSSSSSPSPIPIRKYGFHGSSFRHAVRAASELLGLPLPPPRPPSSSSSSPPSSREEEQDDAIDAVAFHLGAGASAAAIRNGKSVDTSLGATPLQGLVMATRCGDVDPAVPLMVAAEWERREREGGASTTSSPPSSSKSNSKSSSSVVERVLSSLNKEAGLVALAGPGVAPTGDMRDVIAAAAEGGGGG